MGIFWDAVEGFAHGYLEAAGHAAAISCGPGRNDKERGRIERLCRQLGWAVDERLGNTVVLHFNDALGTIRKAYIDAGDEALVSVTVYGLAFMPAREVPEEIIGYLLRQNSEVAIGAWQVMIDKDEDAVFRVVYRALGAGLTGESFKYICESMIGEAAAFDKRMHAAGLLRL